jgi:hypothetical protein
LALFDRRLVARIQDRVDHPDQRTELGPLNRLRPLPLGREFGGDRRHVLIPPSSILSMIYRVGRHSDLKSSGTPAERHTVMT